MRRSLATLVLSMAVLLPESASAGRRYRQSFDRFDNGTTELRDGSTIASNNGTASVEDGALLLTRNLTGSTLSSFRLPASLDLADGFEVSFDFLMDAGGNTPADGFAFSYGPLPNDPQSFEYNGLGEEGFGVGLSVEIDTWVNANETVGYNVAIDGADVPGGAIHEPPPVDGAWHSARILWTADDDGGRVTFSIDDTIVFDELSTPGFQPQPGDRFAFSARTGGVTETLLIDNVSLGPPDSGEQKAARACVVAKLGVVRKYAVGLFRCYVGFAKSSEDSDARRKLDECIALQAERFNVAWERVDERGGCPSVLDGDTIRERVRGAVAAYDSRVRGAVRSADGGKVRAGLVKLGAKHAAKHYAALLRHAKRPDAARRDAAHEADRQKFDAKVEKIDVKADRAGVIVEETLVAIGADSLERSGRDVAALVDSDVLRGLRNGLLAYWSFDTSGPTVVDHAGGPADFSGSMVGHAHRVEGLLSSAMSFDGASDHVRVASAEALAALKGTPVMTISAWIRPEGPGSNATVGGIILNKEGEFQIARFANGTIRVAAARDDNEWEWWQTVVSPPRAPQGVWTHVLVTFRPSGVSSFVNLRLNSGVSYPASARGDRHPDKNEVWIGDRSQQQQSFDGAIDDLAIWNRELSAIEQEALFNGGLGQPVFRTTLPSIEDEKEN